MDTSKTLQNESIEENKKNILKILFRIEETSVAITEELATQGETIDRINNKMDKMDNNLAVANTIIKRMSNLFTIFKPIIVNESSTQTKILNSISTTHNNSYAVDTKTDEYDEMISSLQRINLHAKLQGDELDCQNKKLDEINNKVDKSNDKIDNIVKKINKLT
jgi:uncharacterized coiled-coil protein SlyX